MMKKALTLALLAVIGTVGLWRTRTTQPAVVQKPVMIPDPPPQMENMAFEPQRQPAEPVARADVKRALAAIGRWEDHYKSGRGVVELARFVETQRGSREASGR